MTSAAPRHENEVRLANILSEIKSATDSLEARDRRVRALEGTVNDLMRRMGRPSGGNGLGETDERSQAIGLLEQKHFATVTKRDALLPEPNFSEEQIAEAKLAIRGVRTLMHSTSIDQVPLDQRKALSAFSFGAQGFLLAPEISSQILSCLESVTDIAALMQNINISGASIKFLTDNETWDVAAWACEASCFANNPTATRLRPRRARDQAGELALHCLRHSRPVGGQQRRHRAVVAVEG
jgi:HK97 family phage major capsid protein